ncbi:MAG: DnaB helicase C-terminal domain-containing protein, partial [Myxococcaceae bacterium]|nr:DnaB helicase C-terminal domain-containing protein [Myxococcaceae bacterium]
GVLLDRLDAVARGERQVCLPTGIEVWDELLGGLQAGVVTFIGAQPSVGKSALVGAMVRNLAQAGHRVGLFSLEDSPDWLPERAVAHDSGIPVKVLSTQRLYREQMQAVGDAATRAYEWAARVVREGRSGLTARQVAATARQMVVQYGCRAIFLDHLGELDVEAAQHDRHDLAVANAVRMLRDVAKDFGIPVVVCAHFHRPRGNSDAEPRYMRPSSASWANSAGVERMARVAVGLWLSKDEALQGYVIATVLKQTKGDKDIDFAMRLHRPSGLIEKTGGRRPEDVRGHHEESRP